MRRILFVILLICVYNSFAQDDNNCIDFTNLSSSKTVCKYGYYNNPDKYTGVKSGRHTVMSNTSATDSYTNNKLKVIPAGESYSVRLGNSNTDAEAESITYEYTVDTNEKDLLILKYAAVMEDPDHFSSQQPRFTFSILNSDKQLIDQCYFANFVASSSLGWNQVKTGFGWFSSTVLWKDWTTIGVDLSDFHGQKIYVKLTTYDCSQGAHFGYAYFTLKCDKKVMLTENCGEMVENTFTAPDGFAYSWYNTSNPSDIISTNQSLHVTEQGEYICKCSFVGSPECYFMMSAYAGARYPYARFDYSITDSSDCSTTIQFTNNSVVSKDSTHQILTNTKCDSYLWDFGDGTVSAQESPTHTFYGSKENGYNVTLTAYLSGGKCSDTASKNFDLNHSFDTILYDTVCNGETYSSNGFNQSSAGEYQLKLQTVNGCDSLVNLYLYVHSSYDSTLYDTICSGEIYISKDFNENTSGYYVKNLQTDRGCDSIIRLNLVENPTFDTVISAEICSGEVYKENNFEETAAGEYIQELKSINNCDSTVHLILKVNPVFDTTIFDTVCSGEIYSSYNFNESISGIYTQNLQNINGCDSIVKLNLQVNNVYDTTIDAEICIGETYTENNFNETAAGEYIKELKSVNNCDSIVRLQLKINPVYDSLIYDTICDGETYNSNGFYQTSAGEYVQTLQTYKGCDSTIRLNLWVNPVFDSVIYDTICDKDTYNSNNFTETSAGNYIQNLQTINGCDSTVTLSLFVNNAYNKVINADICLGEVYSENNFLESVSGQYIQELKSVNNCDSIVTLNLSVHPLYDTTIYANICEGETYGMNNFNNSAQGFYTNSLQSIYGCDSVVHLDLGVYPNYYDTVIAGICSNEIYQEYGFYENQSGIYDNYYQTIWGCDSVITLELNVSSAYLDTIRATISKGKVYNRNGFNETQSGNYTQYNTSIDGCDSSLTLVLTVLDELDVWAPTAIIPNDETNNRFRIFINEDEATMDNLIIYDRWGTKIFETKNISDYWDGRYKGSFAPTGVYKYDVYYHRKGNNSKIFRKVGEFMVFY